MLIFEKDITISAIELCEFMCGFSNKINKNYIYDLLSEAKNNIVFYSFDNSVLDINNCPCSLIYYEDYIVNELNIYIMFIATKYRFRKLGYSSSLIKEFINFINKQYSVSHNKINIVLDSLMEAVSFYEHLGFKWVITNKYNEIFDIKEDSEYEHFIMIYEVVCPVK